MKAKYLTVVGILLVLVSNEGTAIGVSPPEVELPQSPEERALNLFIYNTKDTYTKIQLNTPSTEVTLPLPEIFLAPFERREIGFNVSPENPGIYRVIASENNPNSMLQEAAIVKIKIIKSGEDNAKIVYSEQIEENQLLDYNYKKTTVLLAAVVIILGAVAYGATFL